MAGSWDATKDFGPRRLQRGLRRLGELQASDDDDDCAGVGARAREIFCSRINDQPFDRATAKKEREDGESEGGERGENALITFVGPPANGRFQGHSGVVGKKAAGRGRRVSEAVWKE